VHGFFSVQTSGAAREARPDGRGTKLIVPMGSPLWSTASASSIAEAKRFVRIDVEATVPTVPFSE
jgi:hypothetical protein